VRALQAKYGENVLLLQDQLEQQELLAAADVQLTAEALAAFYEKHDPPKAAKAAAILKVKVCGMRLHTRTCSRSRSRLRLG
jgi:hypothetical protein